MSSWSDSKPPNVRLVSRATTSTRSPSRTDVGDVRPAERDPVEHVEVALERQLGVAAGRLADPGHGQAEDRDERLRVADAARREAGELAVEGVVDVARRQREVDARAAGADPAAPRAAASARNRSTNAGQRSVAISKPAAPAWPPWRMNRSAQHARAPRRGRASRRSGTTPG